MGGQGVGELAAGTLQVSVVGNLQSSSHRGSHLSRNPPGLCPDGDDRLQQSQKPLDLTPQGRREGPFVSATGEVVGLELGCLRETSPGGVILLL